MHYQGAKKSAGVCMEQLNSFFFFKFVERTNAMSKKAIKKPLRNCLDWVPTLALLPVSFGFQG